MKPMSIKALLTRVSKWTINVYRMPKLSLRKSSFNISSTKESANGKEGGISYSPSFLLSLEYSRDPEDQTRLGRLLPESMSAGMAVTGRVTVKVEPLP